MQLYRFIRSLLVIIFVSNTIITEEKNNVILPQKQHTIVIDLTNVLFKEDHNAFAKKIGYATLASYAITHWKNPGYRCLDTLAAISNETTQIPHISLTLKDRRMPKCIIELQEGTKTCGDVKTEIAQCIETLNKKKFFGSEKEKNLMLTIINLFLDPAAMSCMIEPIKPTINLIQKLKIAGHRVILFANAPDELFTPIQKKYPDIIKLFDGVIISSQVKKIKPEPDMFDHLFTTHNLCPHDCIIIDDLEATVNAAKNLGMKGIVYDKISNVTKKLRNFGIKI